MHDHFRANLEEALKHYRDAQWLGEHSLLATPYFLGAHLPVDKSTPAARGRVLQQLLQAACQQIDERISPKYSERYRTLLQEYYLRDRPANVVGDELGLSRNVFHISRNGALGVLVTTLVQRLQPALRLEQPPQVTALIERQTLLEQAQHSLQQPQTLALIGWSGMGKSALAAALVGQLARPTFWYTLRTGLNDHAESLIFALAFFAHRHGFSHLWLELTTEAAPLGASQRLDERRLSTLRYAFSQIQPPPLLCFDALDLLQPHTVPEHALVLQLIESLRSVAPIIITAQSAPLVADDYLTVTGLSPAGVAQLIGQTQPTAPAPLAADLHRFAQGNPRLIKLALTALQQGAPLAELAEVLLVAPGIELLFAHTLQRLSAAERQLLMALSVFRSPTPRQLWQTDNQAANVARLLAQGLLESDGLDGVEMPWVYRQLLYRNLPATSRHQLHQQAAQVRSQLGAHTAAAYHWLQAEQPETALAQWRPQQRSELAQGQAATALALFRPLLHSGLAPVVHEQAIIVCAELEQWTGNATQAATMLQTALIKTPILAIEAAELAGVIANDQSNFAQANQAFQQALQVSEHLLELRIARLHKGRAWMHLRQRELDLADGELNLAHYEVENMRGNLAMDRGNFEQAQQHYQQALQLAEALAAHEPIARTCNNLAGIALFAGRFTEAIGWLERALQHYRQTGKLADWASAHITLAVTHNQAGDHQAALQALDEAEHQLHTYSTITSWQAGLIAQGRAEAWLGLRILAQAETAVKQAIAAEEISLLPDAYRVYGEICGQRGDYPAALHWLQQALTLAEENEDRYLAAYTWRALAQLYRLQGEAQPAAVAQTQACELFELLHLTHEVLRTCNQ